MRSDQKPRSPVPVPMEFRRLALHCPPFKEIAAEYEAGRFDDWNHALSAAIFSLANELDAANRRSQAIKGEAHDI